MLRVAPLVVLAALCACRTSGDPGPPTTSTASSVLSVELDGSARSKPPRSLLDDPAALEHACRAGLAGRDLLRIEADEIAVLVAGSRIVHYDLDGKLIGTTLR